MAKIFSDRSTFLLPQYLHNKYVIFLFPYIYNYLITIQCRCHEIWEP